MNNVNTLLDALLDPVLNRTFKDMNLIYSSTIDDDRLLIEITAGFPIEKLETQWVPQILNALSPLFPNQTIQVSLNQKMRAYKTQIPGKGLRGVRNTIAIGSGKGGVGKSTVTVNLAAALSALGARVGILDADIYGPSIPLMLGKTPEVEIKDNKYIPVTAHGIQAMSIGYLTDADQALIWRGPMLAKALIQMLDLTLWNDLDYLLIDLPPGTGDIQLSLTQKIPLSSAIVVTTPQQVATLDAHKAIQLFKTTGIEVLGIVENMSTHICSKCHHQEPIFGEGGARKLCSQEKIPLLGQLPLHQDIRKDADIGIPTALNQNTELASVFLKTALNAAIELSKRPINYADKFPDIAW